MPLAYFAIRKGRWSLGAIVAPFRMSKPRRIVGYIFAVATVLVLIATEVALRLVFGLGQPLLYRGDAEAGYLPVSNQFLRRFGAEIRINEFGMRSDSVSVTPAPGCTRLLFVGDSVVFGTTYVDQGKIFTELVKSALSKQASASFEVLNASAGGWAPANEYQFLASRGTFGSAVVLFVLNTNDLDQAFASFEPSPQFPDKNPPTAIGEVWNHYIEPRILLGIRTSDPGSQPQLFPSPSRARAVLETLERAHRFAAAHQAQFWIVFSPADYIFQRSPAWRFAVQEFRRWATHANINLIDMSPEFARYPHAQIYFDDIHLRPFAHALVAARVVTEVSRWAISVSTVGSPSLPDSDR